MKFLFRNCPIRSSRSCSMGRTACSSSGRWAPFCTSR
nr:MAG TPA: hypothetical protein [Caudoviricetes sp.]DAU71455.1 MAG TPA: hypothetical protein [Caudoviricetes sp.]